MSLILDALRKSERTRQQTLAGQVSATGDTSQRAHMPVPWATVIGILLLANAIALMTLFWRNHSNRSTPVVSQAPATAKTSATKMPISEYRPEIRSLAMEAAAGNSTGAAITPAAVSNASPTSPITNPLPAAGEQTQPPLSEPDVSTVPNPPSTVIPVNSAPPLDGLPLAFQQSLPPLHLDVHGYVHNPADRFVVINMQRYQTGDTLKEGPKIIAITAQGVVLKYNGQTFLLPRP
jgi:general secretion pathway protein B